MNRVLKTAIMGVALGATTLATLPAANASDWRWRHHHSRYHGSHHGDAVVAGIAGLAAGALIGSALSRPAPSYYEYDEPRYIVRRRVVVRPAPIRDYGPVSYAGALEPWTRDWYEYCSDRYRTFNARTGTFTGYDGQQHFCVAN
jgi:hypothetical protein